MSAGAVTTIAAALHTGADLHRA